MDFYNFLSGKISACDIFIHMNGIQIHPDFLKQFSCLKIYQCADDPEASSILSKPVYSVYDYVGVSNIDCITDYIEWGAKNVFWFPLGSSFNDEKIPEFVPFKSRQRDMIFVGARNGVPYPIFGRLFGYHRKTGFMNFIDKKFKNHFDGYGPGWTNGFIDDDKLISTYTQYKFGLNKHNSRGVINYRLFDLSALGLLQFCDNPKSLQQVFELNYEAIGYSSKEMLVNAFNYYNENQQKAEEIAYRGYIRFKKDYTRTMIWDRVLRHCKLI
jgi:hypothetical protein